MVTRSDYICHSLSLQCQARESVKNIPANQSKTSTHHEHHLLFPQTKSQIHSTPNQKIHSSSTSVMPLRIVSQDNVWWNHWPQQSLTASRLPHYWSWARRRKDHRDYSTQLSQSMILPSRHPHLEAEMDTSIPRSHQLLTKRDNVEEICIKRSSVKLSKMVPTRSPLSKMKDKLQSVPMAPDSHPNHKSSCPNLVDDKFFNHLSKPTIQPIRRSHTFTEVLHRQQLAHDPSMSSSFVSLADQGFRSAQTQEDESSVNGVLSWELKCSTWLTHMSLLGGARCLDDLWIYGFG